MPSIMPTLLLLAAVFAADITLDKPGPADNALSVAIQQAAGGGTVTLGPGVWTLERYPAELRSKTGEPARRIDVTIWGTPGQTILRGIVRPHDVLQLNAVAGITLRDLIIESEAGGSNGISMTNGCADIICDRVTVRGLPATINGPSFNGGKAFTVQQGTGPTASTAVFRGCRVERCPVAFGIDAAPDKGTPGAIVIDGCEAVDCMIGVAVSFAASKAEPVGFSCDVLNSRFVDVKRPLLFGRACDVRVHGCEINTLRWPPGTDPYDAAFPSSANVLRACTRVNVSGNTLVYGVPVTLFDFGVATTHLDVVTEPNIIRWKMPAMP